MLFAEKIERDRPFFFVQIADPQIGCDPIDLVGIPETELLAKAFDEANRLRPAFVVICGDMINMPSEGDSVARQGEPQAEEFFRLAARVNPNIPMFLLPGNHDLLDAPTPDSLAWYRRRFGQDRYAFTCGNCLYIVLNSCLFYDDRNCPREAAEQLKWLERTLAQATAAEYMHTFVCMHHSLYLHSRDDEDGYFVLPRQMRLRLLDLFHSHGVRAVFSGHYHRNAYAVEDQLELITTSALSLPLGKDPPGIRIVKIFDHHIEHDYCGLDAAPSAVHFHAKEHCPAK